VGAQRLASWCVSCREEHPVLLDLAASGAVRSYGLNYKDRREDGLAWLKAWASLQAVDLGLRRQVGIDYGVLRRPPRPT